MVFHLRASILRKLHWCHFSNFFEVTKYLDYIRQFKIRLSKVQSNSSDLFKPYPYPTCAVIINVFLFLRFHCLVNMRQFTEKCTFQSQKLPNWNVYFKSVCWLILVFLLSYGHNGQYWYKKKLVQHLFSPEKANT